MGTIAYYVKKLIPRQIFSFLAPSYHYVLSYLSALYYRHPSRSITVIGITGTKGKSTTAELVNAIFEAAGKRTALAGTIRFKVDTHSERNLYKMTMPGRFFVQRFLRKAVNAGCDVAILEMTSEGVKQSRHKWIDLDALIFTNLSPEHIESHGSYEKYIAAKFELARALEHSSKRPRRMIANADDEHGNLFLSVAVEERIPYSLKNTELYTLKKDSSSIVIAGTTLRTPLVGLFNVYNTLAAIACAQAFGISMKIVETALQKLGTIEGRVEQISSPKELGKKITAVVDYAHTPDSLEKLYQAFEKEEKICVLGNTGGGRDQWKRPEMGRIAGAYCTSVILTNEDPYDEDPRAIIEAMERGVEDKEKVRIILDRRTAIATALHDAPDGAVVLVSGKGTDPYIMGPKNTKEPWSDAEVVREEFMRMVQEHG